MTTEIKMPTEQELFDLAVSGYKVQNEKYSDKSSKAFDDIKFVVIESVRLFGDSRIADKAEQYVNLLIRGYQPDLDTFEPVYLDNDNIEKEPLSETDLREDDLQTIIGLLTHYHDDKDFLKKVAKTATYQYHGGRNDDLEDQVNKLFPPLRFSENTYSS